MALQAALPSAPGPSQDALPVGARGPGKRGLVLRAEACAARELQQGAAALPRADAGRPLGGASGLGAGAGAEPEPGAAAAPRCVFMWVSRCELCEKRRPQLAQA